VHFAYICFISGIAEAIKTKEKRNVKTIDKNGILPLGNPDFGNRNILCIMLKIVAL